MDKPQMKREVSIQCVLPENNAIRFNATPDSVDVIAEFGEITRSSDGEIYLRVDARFDFWEVVCYFADLYEQAKNAVNIWLPSYGFMGTNVTLAEISGKLNAIRGGTA